MNNENQERQRIEDDYSIKQDFIRKQITKHTGKAPSEKKLIAFMKFLSMEYENNTSKNSLDNRLISIGKTIINKYDKYDRISSLDQN